MTPIRHDESGFTRTETSIADATGGTTARPHD